MPLNLWHDVPRGTTQALNAIIEIPMGSRVKYELDKKTGIIKYDRVLYSPMHYPANYGFVPQTLWDDGDPLDVLVLGAEELVPGCLIEVRPIGVLDMVDGGDGDAKILAVPCNDPRWNNTNDISNVEAHILEEIKHFFKVYKTLQNKEVFVGEWRDRVEADKDIEKSFVLYDEMMHK
ncbi:MAG TPA: inorganic diphosphatase [Candidatus Paceibacterota bacterium]|nr:inorganic diphosphatase [Candidatus Paceibacterota bacterium]